MAGGSGEPNQVDNWGSWGPREGNSGTGHLVEKALAVIVEGEEIQCRLSKVAVVILLRGDDGGLRKGNFRVTGKLRCPKSCSRNCLVIERLWRTEARRAFRLERG
jgi:hypothetical protein